MTRDAVAHSVSWTHAWVPFLAAVALLAVWWGDGDLAIFTAINRGAQSFGDVPWSALTVMGEAIVLFPLLLLVHHRWPAAGWAAVLGGLATALVVASLKHGIGALRPPMVLDPAHIHVIGPTLRHNAFPSGHTATAALIAGVVVLSASRRWLRWGAVVAALLIGVSRIAVGAHWPSDVLGGFAIGWLGAMAGIYVASRWAGAHSITAQRVLILSFSACAISLFVYDSGYPAARAIQWGIGVLALWVGVLAWRRTGRDAGASLHG